MSDGPHKSLNMRRGWKRLMDRARNLAFDSSEVAEAWCEALQDDWRTEVPGGLVAELRKILGDPEGDLFDDGLNDRLEALRDDTSGHPLACTLLDSVLQVVDKGDRGDKALTKAADYALQERAASAQRQLEEHSLRASSTQHTNSMRKRIDDALAASDRTAVAKRCLGLDDGTAPRAPRRRTGIDDGVSLP